MDQLTKYTFPTREVEMEDLSTVWLCKYWSHQLQAHMKQLKPQQTRIAHQWQSVLVY